MSPDSDSPQLTLIGLGLLGSAVARRWISQGWRLIGYDVDENLCAELGASGGIAASSMEDALAESKLIAFCLPNASISADVLEQILPKLVEPSSSVIIDLTTGAPEEIQANAALAAQSDVSYFSVCVGGSSVEAEQGDAILMVGGDSEKLPQCESLLISLSEQRFFVGSAEAAARMKLVTNLVLGLERLVLGEGLAFAKQLGLNLEQTLKILQAGPARSHVMWTKGQKMITEDWTPQARLDQHWKDVRLILKEAERVNLKLPLSALHDQLLHQCHDRGWGELDNSAVSQVFTKEPLS